MYSSRERVFYYLSKLGHPQKAYATIHVTGTNGKGSVSAKIARALTSAGYKVGLFTSPHLFDYRERIRINDVAIPEDCVEEGLKQFSQKNLHFFESTTLLGLTYFYQERVDIAVIEVGIGGREDSTNVIFPKLSIITSIARDHTQLIGESLEEIAQNKAGIIKPNVPLILGPYANYESIRQQANKCNSPVYLVQPHFGHYEKENQTIAKQALEVLSVPEKAIEEGLKYRLPCRFEEKNGGIFDVAHNPGAFQRLIEALEERYPQNSFRFVIGMSGDKEIKQCLKIIIPHASYIHCVQANHPRAASADQLVRLLHNLQFSKCNDEKSAKSGFEKAKANASNKEKIIVCGSFYIMTEILR